MALETRPLNKTPRNKNPHSYSHRNKTYKGLFFVVGGSENVQNLHVFFFNSISRNCIQYIFISGGVVFLMR